VVGLGNATYLLIYPDGKNSPSISNPTGPMTAHLVSVSDSPTSGVQLTVGNPVALTGSLGGYFFEAIGMGPDLAVVAYVDEGLNNALRAVVIEINWGVVAFGAALTINNGDATGALPDGLWSFLAGSTLDPTHFLIVYSDFANAMSVTASMISITPTLSLAPYTTPGWVLSSPDPDQEGYFWMASAPLSLNRFLVIDSLQIGNSGGLVTLGERKEDPLGVMGKNGQVVLGGMVEVSQVLLPGLIYYGNTQGGIVLNDGTEDARLGVAVDSHTLYLSI